MPALEDGPPELDEATPAELRALINFLNSRPTKRRAERFDSTANAEAFLARCEIGYDGSPLSAAETERLRGLRDAVMGAVDEPDDPAAWAAIDAAAGETRFRVRADGRPGWALEPVFDGAGDRLMARILTDLWNATATGRWDRLGACARCRRVFYDSTRSRTRRWCSYATCGNRANSAAFRDRRRADRGDDET